jgi:hypothetical protein
VFATGVGTRRLTLAIHADADEVVAAISSDDEAELARAYERSRGRADQSIAAALAGAFDAHARRTESLHPELRAVAGPSPNRRHPARRRLNAGAERAITALVSRTADPYGADEASRREQRSAAITPRPGSASDARGLCPFLTERLAAERLREPPIKVDRQ